MSTLQQSTARASIIASLYREAVRQGQSLWFRVASGSMTPTLHVGDQVCIESTTADKLRVGEIAAFETADGLIVHRIVQRQQRGNTTRLLEMADVELHPSWVEEQAVIGRVMAIRRPGEQIDLQHPVAQRCGTVTAYLRYRLYTWMKYRSLAGVLHRCSRLVVHVAYWCLRHRCTSSVAQDS